MYAQLNRNRRNVEHELTGRACEYACGEWRSILTRGHNLNVRGRRASSDRDPTAHCLRGRIARGEHRGERKHNCRHGRQSGVQHSSLYTGSRRLFASQLTVCAAIGTFA
jgi:hypothetical protein